MTHWWQQFYDDLKEQKEISSTKSEVESVLSNEERRRHHTLTQTCGEWPPHVWKLPSMTVFQLVFFNSSRCCFCLPSAQAEAAQVSRNMGSAIFSDATEASGHQLTTHSSEIKTLKTITLSTSSKYTTLCYVILIPIHCSVFYTDEVKDSVLVSSTLIFILYFPFV